MGNRWGNSGNSVRLYLGGSKIPADGDCSLEIKRHLLLGRKVMCREQGIKKVESRLQALLNLLYTLFPTVMTNLDSILKSRDITLPTKVHLVKAMVFPVVIYGCESWTIKKAEH